MAGRKRRATLPDPEELRRRYGENAVVAASIYGSMRPFVYAVFVLMGAAIGVILALTGPDLTGWSVALFGLVIAGASILLAVATMRKAKRIASLRISGPNPPRSARIP